MRTAVAANNPKAESGMSGLIAVAMKAMHVVKEVVSIAPAAIGNLETMHN